MYSLDVFFSQFWTSLWFHVWFCCFLTCKQVSQGEGKVVCYSHLFKNFPQFVVVHLVKSFSVVKEAEVDILLEFCFLWLPWWLRCSRILPQCRRPGFYPWIRKSPLRRKWQPTSVFLPGEFHVQRSLVGYSPWGPKQSDVTEQLTLSLTAFWVIQWILPSWSQVPLPLLNLTCTARISRFLYC